MCFSELDPYSKERRYPPLFGFYVAGRGAGWHGSIVCFCSLTAPLLEPSENTRAYPGHSVHTLTFPVCQGPAKLIPLP